MNTDVEELTEIHHSTGRCQLLPNNCDSLPKPDTARQIFWKKCTGEYAWPTALDTFAKRHCLFTPLLSVSLLYIPNHFNSFQMLCALKSCGQPCSKNFFS